MYLVIIRGSSIKMYRKTPQFICQQESKNWIRSQQLLGKEWKNRRNQGGICVLAMLMSDSFDSNRLRWNFGRCKKWWAKVGEHFHIRNEQTDCDLQTGNWPIKSWFRKRKQGMTIHYPFPNKRLRKGTGGEVP